MGGLILPARYNQQPQFVTPLDKSLSFNAGALVAVNYAVSSSNLATGTPANLQIGTGGVFGVGSVGRYKIMYTGGASSVDERFSIASTTDFAFMAVVDYSGSAGVVSSIIGGDGSGDRSFQFRFNASNQLEFIRFDTGGSPYFATVAAPSRKGVVLGISVGNTFSVYFGSSSGIGTITGTPQPATRLSLGYTFGFDLAANNGDLMYAMAALRGSSVRNAPFALLANPWQLFKAPTRKLWASAGGASPDVTVAVTGQAATVSAGTLRASNDKALNGQAATASRGTLAVAVSMALTGQFGTAARGTLAPSTALALVGASATAQQGNVSSDNNVTVSLSGQAISAVLGNLATSSTVPMAGAAASISQGALVAGISQPLTGAAISVAQGNLSPGASTALLGQQLQVQQGTVFVVGDLTLALTGQSMAMSQGSVGLGQSGGAGRPKRKFQVETSRGVIEVASLDEVADIARTEKRRPKAAPVEVKLEGIKVSTPSLKPNVDYKAIEERMRAQVQAEMDDEEELLMMLL